MTATAIRRFAGPGPTTTSWGWLSSVVQWVRAGSRSPGEQAVIDAVERAALQFGAPVLEATDARDLDERLDAAVEHPDLFRFNLAVTRLLTFDALARAASAVPAPLPVGLVDAIGAGPARTVVQARDLEIATASALAQVLAEVGSGVFESQVGEIERQGGRFFYDPTVPSVVLRANFEGLRGAVASLAIAYAVLRGRRPAPWLAQRLAETYRDGLFEYARLLASIPGVVVSERVVPRSEHIDLEKLGVEHAEAMRRMDELADRALVEGGLLTLSDVTDDA